MKRAVAHAERAREAAANPYAADVPETGAYAAVAAAHACDDPDAWAAAAEAWEAIDRPYAAARARRSEGEARHARGDRTGAQRRARPRADRRARARGQAGSRARS